MRRRRTHFCLLFCLLAAVTACSLADTLNVPSISYPSIQSALVAAVDTDEIIVAEGIYYENINFLGKDVTLRSTDPDDPCVVAATIIDGSQPADPCLASVVTFVNGEGGGAVLTGFTIQNGTGQPDPVADATWKQIMQGATSGGGVFCRGESASVTVTPTITKNVFINNTVEYGGGAIYCHLYAAPTITDNTIENNTAGVYGGAIFTRLYCSVEIARNIIRGNVTGVLGGGIYLADHSNATIVQNLIQANECQKLHGGGMYYFISCSPVIANNLFLSNVCSGMTNNNPSGSAILFETNSNGRIVNNLFMGNTCTRADGAVIKAGSGVAEIIANNIFSNNEDMGISAGAGLLTIYNNDLWSNGGGNYGGGLSDQTGINGNISADPNLAVTLPEPFTLWEVNPGSPCIDAGSNTYIPTGITIDYDGTSRTVNSIVDIGPQEYHAISVKASGSYDTTTIQAAINAASSGDEIVVMPGFYQENINYNGKHLRIRSLDPLDPCTVAQTVIDGNELGSCVEMVSGENDTAALAGFTIQNGHGEFGGGVHIGNYSSPIVMFNYITNCQADRYGGGIDNRDHSHATILYNTVIHNFATGAGGGVHNGPYSTCRIQNNKIYYNVTPGEGGGGIYSFSTTQIDVIDNEIVGNQAIIGNGGGIRQWASPGGVIEGNLIVGNVATDRDPPVGAGLGGGIEIWQGATLVRNNLICGNTAGNGGGVWTQTNSAGSLFNNTIIGNRTTVGIGSGIGMAYSVTTSFINNIIDDNSPGGGMYAKPNVSYPCTPVLTANDLWNNEGGNYVGDLTDQTGINGNISADPVFVDPGGWDDNGTPADLDDDVWIQGDYRLGYHSPCRDAGTEESAPLHDHAGQPRPYFEDFDIGAYEVAIYDLNTDGTVDLDEIVLLLEDWLDSGSAFPADLNGDNQVNLDDFALLAGDWLEE